MGSDQTVVQGSSGSRITMGAMETGMQGDMGRRQSKVSPISIPDDAKQTIVRYWAEIIRQKQLGRWSSEARHIAYMKVFGKDDAT